MLYMIPTYRCVVRAIIESLNIADIPSISFSLIYFFNM